MVNVANPWINNWILTIYHLGMAGIPRRRLRFWAWFTTDGCLENIVTWNHCMSSGQRVFFFFGKWSVIHSGHPWYYFLDHGEWFEDVNTTISQEEDPKSLIPGKIQHSTAAKGPFWNGQPGFQEVDGTARNRFGEENTFLISAIGLNTSHLLVLDGIWTKHCVFEGATFFWEVRGEFLVQ